MYPNVNVNLSILLISEVLHSDIIFEFKNAFKKKTLYLTVIWYSLEGEMFI